MGSFDLAWVQMTPIGVMTDSLGAPTRPSYTPRARAPTSQITNLQDGAPQNQSPNGCRPVMRTPVSAPRSKTPSSSSVDEAPVAAERQAIPGRPSSNAAWPTGWQVACRTGRPFGDGGSCLEGQS